jgi:hypothetical protein
MRTASESAAAAPKCWSCSHEPSGLAARSPGARRCAFAARLDAPDEGVLVREWDSHDVTASYHRSEAFACYQFELDGLLARPSAMTIYSISEAVRPLPSGPLDPRGAD